MSELSYDQFIKVTSEFSLGKLTTEKFHPKTKNLSRDSVFRLPNAINSIKEVDQDALNSLFDKIQEITQLYEVCLRVRNNGGRIFLCGCGATGRLSLTLEVLAKMQGDHDVIGFMAGGDFALIKSVESFEDRMSYGSRQLIELGFNSKDFLIAITEGGETSFVIGAAMEAAKISAEAPYFLYCNPDEQLLSIKRSRMILENENIKKLNLTVGPMALSGSTRMQASTVQMLVTGAAVLFKQKQCSFNQFFTDIINDLCKLDYNSVYDLIVEESKVYSENGYITYVADEDLGISILTDTTERSPTFSLHPFENNDRNHALCYLTIKGSPDSEHAWHKLLKRPPRALDWPELNSSVELDQIYSFDISEKSQKRRSQLPNHKIFKIFFCEHDHKRKIIFDWGNVSSELNVSGKNLLTQHLYLKLLLNTMSTLIMGRMARYESNVMTWVKPSNYKLIDRAVRYVDYLLKKDHFEKTYDEIVKIVIGYANQNDTDEPIVLRAYEHLKNS